ncbi:ATP-dependent OLD family endonuclease [Corallococcus coralloides]|uniref:ATP-dependent OLD family endonuclease n=1 Tax=Corallococcus coralloides TaxID=184914 RepID=A0A410RS29_CORCK|nr:AAA family ATPase [Corallococcus coralloides]QAT84611.1 ATP-dependent OLD family endonuclease [Corallococcus coralloides]
MKLVSLRISNFQSFGASPTSISLESLTFIIGPNGSGKTAVLQSLARLFSFESSLRRIRQTDFHVSAEQLAKGELGNPRTLWIEAQFEFPELQDEKSRHLAVPGNFAHMRLVTEGGIPCVRMRLTAKLDEYGDIEESLEYVLEVDAQGEPVKTAPVQKHERNTIQVHYLPARRDPTDHISYASSSLLGRALRAADWKIEREKIGQLTRSISESLAGHAAIAGIGAQLSSHWGRLHKGTYYADPSLSFARNELESLLRHLTVGFTPGPGDLIVDYSRLSDGQQSILYISLVLSMQAIGRKVLEGANSDFDVGKLRPAIFSLVAMEEPENSLSPHYLGRVIKSLGEFSKNRDAQAVITTHSPSLLKRVSPENIRHLRLGDDRATVVRQIVMPDAADEAYKFVREAIQSFPELYFSRLVVLGEGDSEEVVLPRALQADGLFEDDSSVSIVPLGGRHVNHFWRLLSDLQIPYVTILDLDLARHQGGWGRVRYALQQMLKLGVGPGLTLELIESLPKWNGDDQLGSSERAKKALVFLEEHGVYFSSPLDLDFSMIRHFPAAYGVEQEELQVPDAKVISAVLGKSHGDVGQYSAEQQSYFSAYHSRFKLGSKPVAHIAAMARLSSDEIRAGMPREISNLVELIKIKLSGLPE